MVVIERIHEWTRFDLLRMQKTGEEEEEDGRYGSNAGVDSDRTKVPTSSSPPQAPQPASQPASKSPQTPRSVQRAASSSSDKFSSWKRVRGGGWHTWLFNTQRHLFASPLLSFADRRWKIQLRHQIDRGKEWGSLVCRRLSCLARRRLSSKPLPPPRRRWARSAGPETI